MRAQKKYCARFHSRLVLMKLFKQKEKEIVTIGERKFTFTFYTACMKEW